MSQVHVISILQFIQSGVLLCLAQVWRHWAWRKLKFALEVLLKVSSIPVFEFRVLSCVVGI